MPDNFTSILNARFDKIDDSEYIRQHITQRPMPDGDIGRIDQYMIREKINALLNALYIPSRTELALLSELVRTMKAHCRLTYTSDRQFIQELYTAPEDRHIRSEEHTSELQSLMRISYAVF